jgi:post-segregation antitoxin (ccd killing protein)
MPSEINFSGAKRGQFYKADSQLNLPVYLDQQVQSTLAALAHAKGMDISALVNELLKKDIELIEMAR